MAVTFINQPTQGRILASDTPIVYVFESNQTNQANFCFIIETYFDNVLVSRDRIFPERGNRAHWDISPIAQNYVKIPERSNAILSSVSLSSMYIRVIERYGTTPTNQPYYLGNSVKVNKATCPDSFFSNNWLEERYEPSVKWLTNVPDSTYLLSRNYPMWLAMLNTDNVVQLDIYFYDSSNSQIAFSSQQDTGLDRVEVSLDLRSTEIETLLDGFGKTFEDVDRVEIYMNQSEVMRVQYIPEECGEFNQLSWANDLGGYDQFLFTHNHEQESAITSLEYKKQFGRWNPANQFIHDSIGSGDTQYLKKVQPTGILYSGWIPENYQHWLNSIPEIGLDLQLFYNSFPFVESVNCTDTRSVKLKSRFEDLINFQVSYKKTNFKSLIK